MKNDQRVALDSLSNLLKILESNPSWRRAADPEIKDEIGSVILGYEHLISQARGCKTADFRKVTNTAGKVEFLSIRIWDVIEMTGQWSESLEIIYNEKIEPLTKESVIENYIDALLEGCDCRKKPLHTGVER